MRFLWIEDFDGESNGRIEKKNSLENYYLIHDNINLATLEESLEFLENRENWDLFDVVLIDIRFKVCKDDNTIGLEAIYEKYFEKFLTKDTYYKFAKHDDPNAASAGILIYLALIHRYSFPEERISFITANVDVNNLSLSPFHNIKEVIYKAILVNEENGKISQKDYNDYRRFHRRILKKYNEQFEKELSEIPSFDKLDWHCNNELIEVLRKIELIEKNVKESPNKDQASTSNENSNLKYNTVKSEFEKVGLIVPRAFEKPTTHDIGENKSWSFLYWVKSNICTDYYKLRSNILPFCSFLQNNLQNLNSEKCIELDYEAIYSIIGLRYYLPIHKWTEQDSVLYEALIRAIVHKYEEKDYSYVKDEPDSKRKMLSINERKVLQYSRNWSAHQKIHDISDISVIIVFLLFADQHISQLQGMNEGIFHRLQDDLINSYLINNPNKSTFCEAKDYIQKIETKYSELSKSMDYPYSNNENNQSKEKRTPFYAYISWLGNENNPHKKNVSFKHLYSLFLSAYLMYRNSVKSDDTLDKLAELIYIELKELEPN